MSVIGDGDGGRRARPVEAGSTPFDAVIVGGGPAGLAAATWLGRYRRHTLLIDDSGQRNLCVEQAHGYLGLDPIPPEALLRSARKDLGAYPLVETVAARVSRVRMQEGRFALETSAGSFAAHRVVLATGVDDAFPDVDGFFEHYGADVFHCPTCDGFEANDQRVVVFGWDEQVTGFALELLDWAESVTVVTDGRRFEGDGAERDALDRYGVAVEEGEARRLVGRRGALEAVELASGLRIDCSMAFFSIAHRPLNDLARQLGCRLTDEGCVAVDDRAETSVPGVFAAGDLVPGLQLVQVAAAQGAVAGVHCAQSLRGHRGSPSSPASAPSESAG